MDKLLLLSLQFLPETGRGALRMGRTRPAGSRLRAFAWAGLPARQARPPRSWH